MKLIRSHDTVLPGTSMEKKKTSSTKTETRKMNFSLGEGGTEHEKTKIFHNCQDIFWLTFLM